MIFRQLFDRKSCTYTYLIGDESTRGAFLIDPVIENINSYLQILQELQLELRYAIDTHTHADHITALGRLRENTHCITVMGNESNAHCVSQKIKEGEQLCIGSLALTAIHTPGHTHDSYSFALATTGASYLFTGDTLLIRGSGRTDFQQGDAQAQYHSLFNKLLQYPNNTWVYPGHDYRGWTVSTIGEEKQSNPRLQVSDANAYANIMNALKLPSPALMDIAVPANEDCGV